jgi:hypothetical protein
MHIGLHDSMLVYSPTGLLSIFIAAMPLEPLPLADMCEHLLPSFALVLSN